MGGASSLFPGEVVRIKNCRFNCSVPSKQAPKIPSGDAGEDSRSGAHLSALALETTDALLSPLSSHLRRSGGGGEVSNCFSRAENIFGERGATHNSARMRRDG
jgi:hypothetical protein